MATASAVPTKKPLKMVKPAGKKVAEKVVEKPKAKVKAEPDGEEKPKKQTRNKGVTTGMGIGEYQNATILKNVKAKLTDEQLAEDWRREFPLAKAFDAGTVRIVRKLVNAGQHKNDAPAKPIPGYDEQGNAVPDKVRKAKGE